MSDDTDGAIYAMCGDRGWSARGWDGMRAFRLRRAPAGSTFVLEGGR